LSATRSNEERFNASCEKVGEADVRQKLSSGLYSENRAKWASTWLEQRDIGKSEATRSEEESIASRTIAEPKSLRLYTTLILVLIIALGGAVAFLTLR
jgi:hypothetical protein